MRSWLPDAPRSRHRRHRPRRQVAQRVLPVGGGTVRRAGAWPCTHSTCTDAASPRGSAFTSRSSMTISTTSNALVRLAKSRQPSRPLFLLGHSAGGVISSVYTLEHQAELAGLICESFAFQVFAPDFALTVVKGLSHVAPHLHVLNLKTEDFSRDPSGRAGDERRSADCRRGPAHADGRGTGARRRAARPGVSADHAAGADSSRHRRQGDAARGQPASSSTTPARRTRR